MAGPPTPDPDYQPLGQTLSLIPTLSVVPSVANFSVASCMLFVMAGANLLLLHTGFLGWNVSGAIAIAGGEGRGTVVTYVGLLCSAFYIYIWERIHGAKLDRRTVRIALMAFDTCLDRER